MQTVRVLVFIDEDVIESAAEIQCDRRLQHHLGPVQQQIIVIEHTLVLLGFYIGRKQLAQLFVPTAAPRKRFGQYFVQILFGVDRARVDREARSFGGEAVGFVEKPSS